MFIRFAARGPLATALGFTLLFGATLPLPSLACQSHASQEQAAEPQPVSTFDLRVPVYDSTSQEDWTKPRIPAAPMPKLPMQKLPVELPLGPPTWSVDSPETPAPDTASPTAGTITINAKPLATWSGQSRSLVSEPSAAWWGNTGLLTHNWDAGVAIGAGTTVPAWVRRDPRTFASIDGGFCCDQVALKCDGPNAVLVWFLQYARTATRGSVRIVTYTSEADLIIGTSHNYVLNPQSFGWPTGYWMDYPSLSFTDSFLYCTSNVFSTGAATSREGVVCWRMNLADMKAKRTVGITYTKLESRNFAWRLAQNGVGGTTAYWWHPRTTTSGTVYRWPDSASPTSASVSVGAFVGQLGRPGPYSWTGGGPTNILGRIDWRSTGGWIDSDTVNFMWTCATTTSRGAPYVRCVRIDKNTLARRSEFDIWSNTVMFAYPSAASNRRGDAAGTMTYCSNSGFPTTTTWMLDDLTSGVVDLLIPYGGANYPNAASWGDYMTCQPHPTLRNLFLATGMTMDNGGTGNTNQRPFFVNFGRSRDNTSGADLEASQLTSSTTTLTPRSSITVSARLRSVGDATAPATTSSFRLSTNSLISTSDTLLASIAVPASAPDVVRNYSRTVTVPGQSGATSTCWLGFLADETGAVIETNEANNSASLQVTCVQSLPDLTIDSISGTSASAGGSGSFTMVVKNVGVGPAPATTVSLLLSTNTIISTGDELLRTDSVPALNGNATRTVSGTFLVPHCYSATTAYLGGLVDPANTITEDSETNNTKPSTAISITPYAGSGRYVEWRPRIGGAASTAKGTADFRLVAGPRSSAMCVTAPQNVGAWHLCLWSGSPSFVPDTLTDISLGLINGPLLQAHLAQVPSTGQTFPALSLPNTSGIQAFTVYVHSVWFSSTFTTFLGLGSNSIPMTIRS
ncbi:MAG: hypothetical protein KDC95_21820 [Planctomycetes bacterium]|nr:hypothetical protein [Planctomycetota bacterium]